MQDQWRRMIKFSGGWGGGEQTEKWTNFQTGFLGNKREVMEYFLGVRMSLSDPKMSCRGTHVAAAPSGSAAPEGNYQGECSSPLMKVFILIYRTTFNLLSSINVYRLLSRSP